jgi:hypothetical protein
MKKIILMFHLIILISIFSTNLILSDEIVGETGVNVIVTPASVVCSADRLSWINPATGDLVDESLWGPSKTIDLPSPNCYKVIDGIITTCCPSGICTLKVPDGTDSKGFPLHSCVATTKEKCSDFTSQSECDISANTIGTKNSIGNQINYHTQILDNFICESSDIKENCLLVLSCNCTWEDSICKAVKTTTSICPPILTDKIQVNCKVEVTEYTDNCATTGTIDGKIRREIDPPTANPDDYNCGANDEFHIQCEQVARMDFFNYFNIISVLALLAIFYAFRIGKDKKD